MIEPSTISLTVFSYVTEENDRVVEALYNIMGQELKGEKLTKIGSTSQFGDPFTIYNYETDDISKIKLMLTNISDQLDERSRSYLKEKLVEKLDLEERTLYLRFDKYKAYQQELIITEGSDVIKLEFSYNAYTKRSNSIEKVTELLHEYNLLEE